jgi:hypothetical protein
MLASALARRNGRRLANLALFLPLSLAASPATRLIVSNDACAAGVCPLHVPAPPTVDAGWLFPLAIVAVDDAGNRDPAYAGTVRITSSDPLAVAPSEHAFTEAEGGAVGLDVSLGTLGAQTFSAVDVSDARLSGSLSLVVVQSGPCVPTGLTLCLHGGRFRVEAQWRPTPDAALAAAHAVPRTDETGYFWFFDPNNVEVVGKVLDSCAVDERFWFFAGGLTNTDVTLRVTDTQASQLRLYSSAAGTAFAPIQDTSAFATCP